LLQPGKKAEYDRKLREQIAPQGRPEAQVAVPPGSPLPPVVASVGTCSEMPAVGDRPPVPVRVVTGRSRRPILRGRARPLGKHLAGMSPVAAVGWVAGGGIFLGFLVVLLWGLFSVGNAPLVGGAPPTAQRVENIKKPGARSEPPPPVESLLPAERESSGEFTKVDRLQPSQPRLRPQSETPTFDTQTAASGEPSGGPQPTSAPDDSSHGLKPPSGLFPDGRLPRLSGLVLWLDASQLEPASTRIERWNVGSVGGHIAQQKQADRQPELLPQGLNGKPVARFCGRP
jgi:hypothetical protein